jgi:hypothetical protein
MGLFHMHAFACRQLALNSNSQQRWEGWIHAERLRRLAWALFVCLTQACCRFLVAGPHPNRGMTQLHDASSTFTRNTRPYISLSEIRANELPCSAEFWEAESPEAWTALQPWSKSAPPNPKYGRAFEEFLVATGTDWPRPRDDYQEHLLLATVVRLFWSTMELESAPASSFLHSFELLGAQKDVLHAALARCRAPLVQHPRLARVEGFEWVIQRSCLAQFAHLLDCDEVVNYTHLIWRGGRTTGAARQFLLQWASANPRKVRKLTRAAAYILSAIRLFPFNHYLESYHAFHAGFLIWSMIPPLRSIQGGPAFNSDPFNTQRRGATDACHLDWLGSDDSPEAQTLGLWIDEDRSCTLRMHGVPDLLAPEGPRNILQMTADILKRMPVWGIAQVFRNAILRTLHSEAD